MFLCVIISQQRTLVLLHLVSTNSPDLNTRKEFFDSRFGDTLIIAEYEEIRMELADRGKYIGLMPEDHIRIRECSLYDISPEELCMYWVASLA